MRVLLAGSTGTVGTHVVRRLRDAGHEVLGITRRAGSLAGTGAQEIVADVSDRRSFLDALSGLSADAVIDEIGAAVTFPSGYAGMRTLNRQRAEGTSTLIAAARRLGAKNFVAASPFYGYGFRDHGDEKILESAPFGEADGTANDDVLLGVTRHEQQVRAFGGITLRYGLIYAPGATSIPPIPRRWVGSLPIVHADDAAAAAVLAVESPWRGQSYNIADDSDASWRDLQSAQALFDGFRPPLELPNGLLRSLAPFGSQIIVSTSLRLSTDKARDDLGWYPGYPVLPAGLPSANTRADVGVAA